MSNPQSFSDTIDETLNKLIYYGYVSVGKHQYTKKQAKAALNQAVAELIEAAIDKQVAELCYFDQDTEAHKKRGILVPVKELKANLLRGIE